MEESGCDVELGDSVLISQWKRVGGNFQQKSLFPNLRSEKK